MKKALLILVAIMGLAFVSNAQNIGVRLGTDGEISFQQPMGSNNRLELDLGIGGFHHWSHYHHVSLTGIYQWHWFIVDSFGWFVGPGAQVSLFQNGSGNNYFNISVGGQIGIDYEFPFPLQLSLDTRPMWNFLGDHAGFGWGLCLGVRYRI